MVTIGKEVPEIRLDTPGGEPIIIRLYGKTAARFFGAARKVFGFGDKPIKELADALVQNPIREVELDALCDALKTLFPPKILAEITDPETGDLALDLVQCCDLFYEAFDKVVDSMLPAEDPESKKLSSSAESSPQS